MSLLETATIPITKLHRDIATVDISIDGHTITEQESELLVKVARA